MNEVKANEETCNGCPQWYLSECRAYCMPHSEEERAFRSRRLPNGSSMKCEVNKH
jgi:hypothetical protein